MYDLVFVKRRVTCVYLSVYLSMNLRVVKEQLKDFQDVDDIFSPDDIVVQFEDSYNLCY